ncbi:hypothetical protein [Truepera radiovictrix]|uniref:Organic solvent tolerance-like N-terminal domain-containing protein n=1 Tax=Truepera radiovictrix (strain DSM 17093 / CIP 108686 / LMG 22925 / RQ-24) TaxID=649638 RepID=D7CVA6_TRURR|nr:hypothetical protein [Truepera radiovictrix]ADI14134.1 conserved hypothetical protein [Truepera radiovictrix DSM 17093]WMT57305.1 hypothetical protein RCV51_14975 [Truepera radiovictrix]
MRLRRSLLRGLWLYAALSALSLAAPAEPRAPLGTEADFAALSVRPYGAQDLDLATGITTLPDGGELSLRDLEVTLAGSFVRFLEGDFVEVAGATVTGAFGRLEAPALHFEVASQTLRAEGGVRFESAPEGDAEGTPESASESTVTLAAETATVFLEQDVAVLEGEVTSSAPALSGARAFVDLAAPQALLVGPYTYQEGPVTLRGAAGETLALSWDEAGAVSADTEVPPALLERFAPHGL